ncbi:MFS general substrate transporter [Rhodocollybia butyracea]|uniref:MFS general substrate transporter n=1 Tax=Rhodocollybia butyracea TaxID=206335 RepID=A0A9P5Q1R2_9AGAR|nr:MFS general substrate transporter [Rhodocollybia butyracea]
MTSSSENSKNIQDKSLESDKGDGYQNEYEELTASDLATFHEREAGRLILDPLQAKIVFGEAFTSRLKLTVDGSTILWPQPTDDPLDPQNWSSRKKDWHLMILVLATIIPNFDSAIGIASVFPLAVQYKTTTEHINDLTSNWSIFLLGPCGIFATAPQVTGLFVIDDIYPFHLRARKIGIWTTAFIIGPHLSPFVFGFLVARANWRWAFGIGCMYGLVVLLLIVFGMEETLYDRRGLRKGLNDRGFRSRLATLVGITGWRTASQGPEWKELIMQPLRLIWRPHFIGMYLFEAMTFGFPIGVNITNTIFLQSPPPLGFGLDQITVAGIYATPIVAVFIGEVLGRYFNDWVMYYCVRHNDGIFEAESRLWTCYISVPLYLIGFLVLGAAFQNHFNIGVVVVGWAFILISCLMTTTAVSIDDPLPLRNLRIVCGLFILVVPLLQYKGNVIRRRFST